MRNYFKNNVCITLAGWPLRAIFARGTQWVSKEIDAISLCLCFATENLVFRKVFIYSLFLKLKNREDSSIPF